MSGSSCSRPSIPSAAYRREARRDRSLPPALPTSAIEFTKYEPSQVALDFNDRNAYPAWRKAWEAIESPVHRGYHLFCLLTGCRPGEASRIRRADIETDSRMFVIRNAKAGKDIHLPITPEIAFAISLAVNAEVKPHHEVKGNRFGLPGLSADIAACRVANPWPSSPAFLFHGRGGLEDRRPNSSLPDGARAQGYLSRLYLAADLAERPGDAESARADFQAHRQTARAYARRPSRCPARTGRTDREKAQSRRSGPHRLRRGRRGRWSTPRRLPGARR